MTFGRTSGCFVLTGILLAACAARTAQVAAAPPTGSRATGVFHPLQRGQTLYALSRAYGVPADKLASVNNITDPTSIPSGTKIFVPGAERILPISPPAPSMLWPLKGRVMTPFGGRGGHHDGVDIDGDQGDDIRAAASGEVVRAGRDGEYGLRVILDHGKGLTTLYAHASSIEVKRGDTVQKGDLIAHVGRSGNAHGSHLHFEVRRNDRPVDPRPFLD